jgi:hypothetical protein
VSVFVARPFSEGQIGRLPTLAEGLVRRRVAVIAAMGGSCSALAAKGATAIIPIVFTMGDADLVELGVVASRARPGGKVTGISLLGGELGANRLEPARARAERNGHCCADEAVCALGGQGARLRCRGIAVRCRSH